MTYSDVHKCCKLAVTLKPGCHQVEGNSIKWQNWHIRHSFNYREGLVLHDVGYEDGGRIRPVMHRGSLVEMCVPYADPNPPFQRKCAFDVSPTPKALQSEIGCWKVNCTFVIMNHKFCFLVI